MYINMNFRKRFKFINIGKKKMFSAISKQSRSIFMQLDANAGGGKPLPRQTQGIQRNRSMGSNRFSENEQEVKPI